MGEVENIPCRPTIRELYAPTYCGYWYIEDVDTLVWDCGVIPSERLLERDFEHTIEFGLSRGEKLIYELHRTTYSSNFDFRLGYQQTTYGWYYGHYDFFFIPLGLTDIFSPLSLTWTPYSHHNYMGLCRWSLMIPHIQKNMGGSFKIVRWDTGHDEENI